MTSILICTPLYTGEQMHNKTIKVDRFNFEVTVDPSADAINAIEVLVFFIGEQLSPDPFTANTIRWQPGGPLDKWR